MSQDTQDGVERFFVDVVLWRSDGTRSDLTLSVVATRRVEGWELQVQDLRMQ